MPYQGANEITNAYIGSGEVQKIYVGSYLVYQKSGPAPTYTYALAAHEQPRDEHYIDDTRTLLLEDEATNLLADYTSGETLTSLAAGDYTLQTWGGSASASGATDRSYGAASEGSPLTFTVTRDQNVTITNTDATYLQLESGTVATSRVETYGYAATRKVEVFEQSLSSGTIDLTWLDADGIEQTDSIAHGGGTYTVPSGDGRGYTSIKLDSVEQLDLDDLSPWTFSRASAATQNAPENLLPSLPSGVMWWDLTQVFEDGRIPEQTGVGETLTIGSADGADTNDPAITSGGLDGDGSDDVVQGPTVDWMGGHTVIAVAKRDTGGSDLVGSGTNDGDIILQWNSDQNRPKAHVFDGGVNEVLGGTVLTDGTWYAIGQRYDGSGLLEALLDGSADGSTSFTPSASSSGASYFFDRKNGGGTTPFEGVIAAVYIATTDLSNTEIAEIQTHAAAVLDRAGISHNL